MHMTPHVLGRHRVLWLASLSPCVCHDVGGCPHGALSGSYGVMEQHRATWMPRVPVSHGPKSHLMSHPHHQETNWTWTPRQNHPKTRVEAKPTLSPNPGWNDPSLVVGAYGHLPYTQVPMESPLSPRDTPINPSYQLLGHSAPNPNSGLEWVLEFRPSFTLNFGAGTEPLAQRGVVRFGRDNLRWNPWSFYIQDLRVGSPLGSICLAEICSEHSVYLQNFSFDFSLFAFPELWEPITLHAHGQIFSILVFSM